MIRGGKKREEKTNENLRGLRPAFKGTTRRLLHYGEGEDWWWLKEGDSLRLAVKSNTADPRHGYDELRRHHDSKTRQASETTGLNAGQKTTLLLIGEDLHLMSDQSKEQRQREAYKKALLTSLWIPETEEELSLVERRELGKPTLSGQRSNSKTQPSTPTPPQDSN